MTFSIVINREFKTELNNNQELVKKIHLSQTENQKLSTEDMDLLLSILQNNISIKSPSTKKSKDPKDGILKEIEKTHAKLNQAKDTLENKTSALQNLKEGTLQYDTTVKFIKVCKEKVQDLQNQLVELNQKLSSLS